jgi:hypothetical protein
MESDPDLPAWETISVPMTVALCGVLLTLLLFLPAVIGFFGPFGDCFDDACRSESRVLAGLARSQGQLGLIGYPILVVGLLALTTRTWHAWILLAGLSMIVVGAGSLPILTGFWEIEPRVLGVAVPLVSPGFAFWIPPALVFLAASALGTKHARGRPVEAADVVLPSLD